MWELIHKFSSLSSSSTSLPAALSSSSSLSPLLSSLTLAWAWVSLRRDKKIDDVNVALGTADVDLGQVGICVAMHEKELQNAILPVMGGATQEYPPLVPAHDTSHIACSSSLKHKALSLPLLPLNAFRCKFIIWSSTATVRPSWHRKGGGGGCVHEVCPIERKTFRIPARYNGSSSAPCA